VYRVVTKYRNGSSHPIVERGPWHASKKTANDWADTLRAHGYVAFVESQSHDTDGDEGEGNSDNDDLMNALASMA